MSITSTPPLRSVLAVDAMRTPVVAVDPGATLREIATLMSARRVHCVVIDGVVSSGGNERPVWAIVSDLDLVRALRDAPDATAGQIAGTEAVTAGAGDDLDHVAGLFCDHECSHVVVIEEDRPVGVISTLDLISAAGD
jgi:CBS domain-containing protein